MSQRKCLDFVEFEVRPKSADRSYRDVSISAIDLGHSDKSQQMLLEIRSQGIETEKPRKVIQFPFQGHHGRISMYGSDQDSLPSQDPPS